MDQKVSQPPSMAPVCRSLELVSQVTGRPKPPEQGPGSDRKLYCCWMNNFFCLHISHMLWHLMVKQFLLTNMYHWTDDKLYCLVDFQTPTHNPRQRLYIFCLSEYILTPRFDLLVLILRQCFSILQGTVHFQSPTHGPWCLRARWHVAGIMILGLVFTSEGNLRWGLTDTCAYWDASLAMLFSNWRTGYEQLLLSLILISKICVLQNCNACCIWSMSNHNLTI